jgi:hypothetical protein
MTGSRASCLGICGPFRADPRCFPFAHAQLRSSEEMVASHDHSSSFPDTTWRHQQYEHKLPLVTWLWPCVCLDTLPGSAQGTSSAAASSAPVAISCASISNIHLALSLAWCSHDTGRDSRSRHGRLST